MAFITVISCNFRCLINEIVGSRTYGLLIKKKKGGNGWSVMFLNVKLFGSKLDLEEFNAMETSENFSKLWYLAISAYKSVI